MTLDDLPRDMPPSPALEGQIIERLRAEGLVAERARRRWLREGIVAAALLMAFVSGWYAGRLPAWSSGRGERFLLLLYDGDATTGQRAAASGERQADRVREYSEWARQLAQSGNRVSGEKLNNVSRVVPAAGEAPPSGASLGGFFVVDAAGMRDAVEIAEQHPHVRHGGTIVIRPIERTP